MRKERFTLGDVIIYTLLALLSLTIVFAFLHLLSISLSSNAVATKGGLLFVPREVTFDNYSRVFKNRYIWIGYKNTLFRTIVGTSVQLMFTALGAYVLSKKYFPHRTFWTLLIVFTMFFSGGLIPTFLLVKNLGLTNTYASMILPGLISAYNLTIMRNFFQSLPEEIEESCMIDGAGRMRIFWQFILPLSTPILATVALWLAVGHWNAWFDVLIYISDSDKRTLQVVLRNIIITGTKELDLGTASSSVNDEPQISSAGLKAASIYVATIPILCVYPFLQKYFVKGIMVGSLKG
ncbi:MAG: carbohydrate ABC transporter permease [Clostridia bacterium]|nr:carbohydrate ABC transporter permease [Clostridia bacterium]MBR5986375.1 carbohydrate ABC transporter permease [Clostridia bacterium]MBR6007988.1 carbohydrate ABC transporter permease [Clostridia bacterium]